MTASWGWGGSLAAAGGSLVAARTLQVTTLIGIAGGRR
jgi:hypothetical protein